MPTVRMRTPRYRGDATSRGAGSAALQGAQLRLHGASARAHAESPGSLKIDQCLEPSMLTF